MINIHSFARRYKLALNGIAFELGVYEMKEYIYRRTTVMDISYANVKFSHCAPVMWGLGTDT
jgi:hypothetical protein